MGTYKVPQNVESEDKILGPLSLKQFIYAVIGIGYGFLTFAIFKSLIVIWIIIGLPPMLALLALGLYQKEDQPLETYVVAVAQFFVRPKTRFWQKEPIAEVFRVEPPPPKPEMVRRDPREVRSQLAQLADLVDTRGWSAKQPELQEPEESPVIDLQDRIGAEVLNQTGPVPAIGEVVGATSGGASPAVPAVTDADDMLNVQTPSAQNLNVLIENSVKSIREEALQKARSTAVTTTPGSTIQPSTPKTPSPAAPSSTVSASGMTVAPSGAILKLAAEGGELTVAQIAAQAHKQQELAEGQTVDIRHANTSTT
jgi:hypothetical protein